MFNLTGKTALVTGATGGIGEAIARALHAQGATVSISGRNTDKLNALAADLKDRVHVLPADLSNLEAVDKLVSDADAAMGQIDILVNNAGLTRDNLSMRMKDEEWSSVIDTNLSAVFRLARGVLRPMMKAKGGRIINITSVVGSSGNPGQANYAAAKAGVAGMSRALAREIGSRNITVNCVAPGFIDTDMTKALSEDQQNSLKANIPLQRLGTPEDIAHAVAFLASPGAGYITGTTLHVNGGLYLS